MKLRKPLNKFLNMKLWAWKMALKMPINVKQFSNYSYPWMWVEMDTGEPRTPYAPMQFIWPE